MDPSALTDHHHVNLPPSTLRLHNIQATFQSQKRKDNFNMSGTSNVGQASVYEAGDQRHVKQEDIDEAKKENRFHEGKENSHKALDSSESGCSIVPSRPD